MTQQTITALYDSREYANNAALMLKQAGVAAPDITVSPDDATTAQVGMTERPAKGFWANLESLFGGTDDHDTYVEGLRRGGILLTAHVDDGKVDDAIRILEQHGSVDLDERETSWRSEGWTGGTAITGGGVADEGAGPLRSMASNNSEMPRITDPASPMARSAPAVPVTKAAAAAPAMQAAEDEVIQIAEETLKVGKRAVSRGRVRIHSYVVETKVSEDVTLRDETITVDRRPVNRPVAAGQLGADAFRDRTVEMEEVDEEAVVAKSTRVVEEIGIRKDVSDRTQTVSDTVRSTKVEVEDGRTSDIPSGLLSGFTTEIVGDMEVVGSDGRHVGLVDHVDGATIKLKKNDPASGGSHHLIPTDWVKTVDVKVMLKTAAADVKSRWTTV